VSSLLLHPLPYPGADRVVLIDQLLVNPAGQAVDGLKDKRGAPGNSGLQISVFPAPSLIRQWRTSHAFTDIEPYAASATELGSGEQQVEIAGGSVLPGFARFAGVSPLIGRGFVTSDIGSRVVLLGEGLWRAHFGGDPSIVGRVLTLDDSSYTVAGVMPAALREPGVEGRSVDVWFPIDLGNSALGYHVIGRLRSGVSIDAAQRELDTIATRSGTPHADGLVTRIQHPAEAVSFRNSLDLLAVAVGFVLLVACANVAHLLLARSVTRHREMAIRVALGAGRIRLLRQLLTETTVLAFIGAGLGTALGWLGLHMMIVLRPASLPELASAQLDHYTVALAIGIAGVSGIAFGVLGALQPVLRSSQQAFKAAAPTASQSRSHDRVRSLLVVSEMALSAILLVGAMTLIRSVIHLQRTDLGFDPGGLYAIQIPLAHSGRYADSLSRATFMREVELRLRRVPGVHAVAAASAIPGHANFRIGALEVQGEPAQPRDIASVVSANAIGSAFFQTMGIRRIEGGLFTDTTAHSAQVIVNEAFARRHWVAGAAEGHRIRVAYNGAGAWLTIVGVVGDVLPSGPIDDPTAPTLYTPASAKTTSLVVRTTGTRDIVTPVRALVASIDPRLRVDVNSVDHIVDGSIAQPRFVMVLLTAFTVLALALAAVGLYGVMSYSVAQRTREIGIRIALGATNSRIARLVVIRGGVLAVVGVALGLVAAHWATRLLEHSLVGVWRSDLPSFLIGAAILLGTAVLACMVPTRRAVAVDPIAAIRSE
jgi:putative ABC transport system permease protein